MDDRIKPAGGFRSPGPANVCVHRIHNGGMEALEPLALA